MTAHAELLTALLPAGLFALAWTMALLLALVGTAPECLAANVSTANIRKPTWLIFKYVLTAQARLGRQEGAFRAALFVSVTVVAHLWVAAIFGSLACKTTWRWLRAARKWRLQYSASTVATEFVEDGFPACSTGSLVAELLAAMFWVATL
jgi:hypothetical protein